MMKAKMTLNMVVSNAISAMDFYVKVFGAKCGEVYEFPEKEGSNEANIFVEDMALRLIDANVEYDCVVPKENETDSIWLQIVVSDVEHTLELARNNGAKVLQEIEPFS